MVVQNVHVKYHIRSQHSKTVLISYWLCEQWLLVRKSKWQSDESQLHCVMHARN